MGLSVGSITKPFKKVYKKVSKTINRVDPTGITGTLWGMPGGAVGGLLARGLGMGGKGGSGGQSGRGRQRYQRRKRNPWKSRRQRKFEAAEKQKLLSSGIRKTLEGQKKPNTTSLRGRNAGTSSRSKSGKAIGSLAYRMKRKKNMGKVARTAARSFGRFR